MTKIVRATSEQEIQNILALFSQLSIIQHRFDNDVNYISQPFSSYEKHTVDDIWWFEYNLVFDEMGDIGQTVATMLEGFVSDIKYNFSDFVTFPEVDLVADGYTT